MEQLLEAGAADVWHTPIYMKKNRPGRAAVGAVCTGEKSGRLWSEIIFTHTTTIGILPGITRWSAPPSTAAREIRVDAGVAAQAKVKMQPRRRP